MARLNLQARLFGALLVTEILGKHRSIITEALFEDGSIPRRAMQTLLRLYDKLGRVPDQETLAMELILEHEDFSDQLIEFYRTTAQIDPNELIRIYGPELLELIERSHLQRCLVSSLHYLEAGNKAGALAAMSQAKAMQVATDEGSYLESDVEARYSEDNIQGRGKRWLTGYPSIDRILSGGPAVAEVHGFVGPSGSGKSRLLKNLLLNSVYQGAFAVYCSLEIGKSAAEVRLDQMLTGLTYEELRTKEGRLQLGRALEKLKQKGGDFHTVKFIPYRMNVIQIGQHLRSLPRHPDVVALDYMELLATVDLTRSGNIWEDQGRMYSEFHGIMEDLVSLGWLATQTKKGERDEITTPGQVAGSGHKQDPLDSFWSIYLSGTRMQDEGKFGLYNMKNRWGPQGSLVRLTLDVNRGAMRVREEEAGEDPDQALTVEAN